MLCCVEVCWLCFVVVDIFDLVMLMFDFVGLVMDFVVVWLVLGVMM